MSIDWNSITGGSQTANFGNPTAEAKAARDATVVSPLADLGLIRASGADVESFLHNLMTNDVQGIPADGVQRAGFCTPKGRLLADFLIWRDGSDFLLQTAADVLPGILKKLSMYVLRAKAKLTDASGELALLGVAGPSAGSLLGALGATPPGAMHTTRFEGGMVVAVAEQRFELAVTRESAARVWQKLSAGAHPVGTDAWQLLDIAAGIPRITLAVQEQFVPQMVNFEMIGGVGFKKGCYPGQEIVARTQYLGKIKKRMLRAALTDGNGAAGAPLYAPGTGDQVCGNVVSIAPSPEGGSELLAVVPEDVAANGEIHIGRTDGPVLHLLNLPYNIK